MYAELWFSVLGITLLAAVWRTYNWLRSGINREAESGENDVAYPSVSVIRPIKGLDTNAEQNIRAAFDNDYPGDVETFFVFDDDKEPAVPVVKKVLAERKAVGLPTDARIVYSGQPPANRTGKLNAMIAGLKVAKNELVAFVDSDIREDPTALKAVVQTLRQRPDAGSAFAPVVATESHDTIGDAGYALLVNGLYGPAAAATVKELGGEMPFIMGQFMVMKREAIAAMGGLEDADGQLVDDMYIGTRLKEEGYSNVVSPHRVRIIQRGMDVGAFFGTYVRWIAFSRSGLPGASFKLNLWLFGLAYWLGLAAGIAAAVQGLTVAALTSIMAPLFVSAVMAELNSRLGGTRLRTRHAWAPLALFLVAPVVYASVFLRHEVNWRGRRYQLNAGSRLG